MIGFTGPSGSGKTTLAKWLSGPEGSAALKKRTQIKHKIHYFEGSASLTHTEEQRNYLKEKYDYVPKGHQNVINISSQNPEFGYDFQRLLMEGRRERIEEFIENLDDDGTTHVIVTDRTFIDIAAYSALQCAHNIDDEKMNVIFNSCVKFSNLFNLTFVVKPNDGWTEDNGSRVPRNFYQNHVVYPVVESMAFKITVRQDLGFNDSKISYLREWDLGERKDQVIEEALNIITSARKRTQRDGKNK